GRQRSFRSGRPPLARAHRMSGGGIASTSESAFLRSSCSLLPDDRFPAGRLQATRCAGPPVGCQLLQDGLSGVEESRSKSPIRNARRDTPFPTQLFLGSVPGRSPMNIPVLGAARFPSPLQRWVDDAERVPHTIVRTVDARPEDGLLFELAGARERLFFDPAET